MSGNPDYGRRAQDWDDFLQTQRPDIGFMQSTWWAEVMEDQGWGHFGVVFRDDGRIIGGARVSRLPQTNGQASYYIPEGPVLPDDEREARAMFEAILDFIDKKRRADPDPVSHLRIEPRWTERPSFVHGFREAGSWYEPRRTLHVDLGFGEAELLAQMKPKGRYNIRLAQRSGVTVVDDRSPKGVEDFQKLHKETVERQGLKRKRSRFYRDLIEDLFHDDRGSLLFAEHLGERLATALVVYFGDRATYLFGGSRALRREVMAPYLLHFEAMRAAKAHGHRWYDLYGVSPADKPDHRWAGISTFKRKFGGLELGFVPALDLIYDDRGYAAYRRSKSRT